MKIRDLILPKCLHSSPFVRRQAIDTLQNLTLLRHIIKKDPNHSVRKKAAMKYYKVKHQRNVKK